ncbi:MAG: hypothetical protein SNH73_07355 [Rikenellaceae bacterium]
MLTNIIIVLVAIAIYAISQIASSRKRLRNSLNYHDQGTSRLRICVVVSGIKEISYIASLLQSESTSYQVVVVADYASHPNLLHSTIQYFGLFPASYSSTGEIESEAIRALYRSHKRIFSRVVVVDSPYHRGYTPFEVGAAISEYNYNLQIYSSRTLRTRAINNLLLELSTQPEGNIEQITSAIGERFKLLYREAALPRGKYKIEINRSKQMKIYYRILK